MAKKKKEKLPPGADRVIATNRRARHEYELGKSYEAGLVLIGSEARALRDGPAEISDAWVDLHKGEAWVKGMRIASLPFAFLGHPEKRDRKLLLHLSEIRQLQDAQERERMTLIVTKIYFKGGRVKIELCVAKGKKLYDKRQTLRQRTADKEARVAIRSGKRAE